jgi:hypothetical protein
LKQILRRHVAQLATFLQERAQVNIMRNIGISKSIVISAILLATLGSNVGAVSRASSERTQNGTAAPNGPNMLLVNQCHSEARARHSNGTFTLNRFNQSPDMRRHTSKLASFCSAYAAQRAPKYVAQVGVTADNANSALAFANACKAEARAGHTVVFRPFTQHVERMAALCDSMARDIASR